MGSPYTPMKAGHFVDRRQFLATCAVAAIGSTGRAHGMGKDSALTIGLLDHGAGARSKPQSVQQLLWEVSKRTSIRVNEKPKFVRPTDPDLHFYPLLVWIGNGDVPPFTGEERSALLRFLRGGGTLFIDDASPTGDDRFHEAVYREMKAVWPDSGWQKFGNNHTIYRSFYLLEHMRFLLVHQLKMI